MLKCTFSQGMTYRWVNNGKSFLFWVNEWMNYSLMLWFYKKNRVNVNKRVDGWTQACSRDVSRSLAACDSVGFSNLQIVQNNNLQRTLLGKRSKCAEFLPFMFLLEWCSTSTTEIRKSFKSKVIIYFILYFCNCFVIPKLCGLTPELLETPDSNHPIFMYLKGPHCIFWICS